MISVVLAERQHLIRTAVACLLRTVSDIEIVGEAANSDQTLSVIRNTDPDIVLLEIDLPGIGGLETTRRLTKARPDLGVIVLTRHAAPPFPSRLLKAGARGYITKSSSPDELVDAIRAVHNRKRYLCNEIARRLALSALPGSDASPLSSLSPRELQIMLMVTKGQTIQEISRDLHLSPKTVATNRYRLYQKLNVGNDVQLTHVAILNDLIEAGEWD
jgi:two-component system invasion response regulator UvrY